MSAQPSEFGPVVGVDVSRHPTMALRAAAEFAGLLGLPLVVINCWSRPRLYTAMKVPDGDFPFQSQLEQTASRLVEEDVERAFGAHPPSGLQTAIRYGHAAYALIEESRGARLLVLGRMGGSGFPVLRLGSVSSACAAHAHCPVLVVNNESATSR